MTSLDLAEMGEQTEMVAFLRTIGGMTFEEMTGQA